MIRLIVRSALRLLACAALALAAAAPSHGAQVQLPVAIVLPVQILGADTFCTGGFVAGGTASAPTLTCVTGGSPGPLTCSILGAPSGTVAPNTPVSLTMSCSGGTSPYTYSWSPVAGTAATLATSVAATTTFTATATDSAAATSQKSVTVTVSNSGGGGAISCTGFANTRVLDISWSQSGSQLDAFSASVGSFGANDALVVRFTTPALTAPGLGYIEAGEYSGPPTIRFAKLSATACDFSGAMSSQTPQVYFTVGPNGFGAPSLTPSTTYYFNLKNASCGASCDVIVVLQKPSGL